MHARDGQARHGQVQRAAEPLTRVAELQFSQVDVFAASPLGGNAVAVVHDAEALSDAQMASFARWTNLSETTFLLTPRASAADYRLRIFTPQRELPFAGHPTLGSAHAWLAAGGTPRTAGVAIQECDAGLVPVRVAAGRAAFAAPPCTRTGPADEATLGTVAAGLGTSRERLIAHQWADNGPGWLVVELDSVEELLALTPRAEALQGLDVGAFAMTAPGSPHRYEVRAFVPGYTECEDPVTGSLNAGLAQWLRAEGRVPASYTAHQGTALRRDGVITIEDDGTEIWVGGTTTTVLAGRLSV